MLGFLTVSQEIKMKRLTNDFYPINY